MLPVLSTGQHLKEQAIRAFTQTDYTGCIRFCDSALKENSHQTDVLLLRGKSYAELHALTFAVEDYDRILAITDTLAEVHALRGFALFMLKEYKPARKSLITACALDTSNALYYFTLAKIEQQMQKWSESLEDFSRAIRYNPFFHQAYKERGYLHLNLFHYQDALRDFDSSLKYNQSDPDVYLYRGMTLISLRRYTEALTIFDRCIRLRPQNADAWFNKGLVYFHMKKYDRALGIWDTALVQNPTLGIAHFHKAMALMETNRLNRSRACESLWAAMEYGYVEAIYYIKKYCE